MINFRWGGQGVVMFGSSNNQNNTDGAQVDPAAATPANNSSVSSFTMDPPPHQDAAANTTFPTESTASPVVGASSAPHLLEEPTSPVNDVPTSDDGSSILPPAAEPVASDGDSGSSDLLDIKQQALQQLSPLVGHLEQTPEDKFKTLMMMIQANDNQDLIKNAYEAAQAIPDEKAKSQALLDVVNEINYFTQKKAS